MTAAIIRADARALPLPDGSVDLIVTSPPYWGLRDYRDAGGSLAGQIGAEPTPWGYLGALWEATAEWVRVLKPSGSLFVVLGDKYANRTRGAWRGSSDGYTWRADSPRYIRPKDLPEKSLIGLPWRYAIGCIDQLGLILRSEIVWSKPSPMPESVTDRARRSHEQVFHFTLRQRYYSDTDAIREPHRAPRRVAGGTAFGARDRNLTRTRTGQYAGPHPLGAIPGSVWEIATQPLRVPSELATGHDAAYPPSLVRRIVVGWSPTCGTVLDPFGGTGTTALIADLYGRHGISVDLSADYCRIAAWRVRDPRERARGLDLPAPPERPHGHPTLFGDEVIA
ncbi:DNA-methyltransferase [Nonomuraea sp. NPDC050790]|uniref:DNA-methyltransferase n=1 Tax=Nonomuraea sp. NPDC050790 TaxID=3364371 RepID=UPI0037BAC13C